MLLCYVIAKKNPEDGGLELMLYILPPRPGLYLLFGFTRGSASSMLHRRAIGWRPSRTLNSPGILPGG